MADILDFDQVKVGSSYQSCCVVVKNMQRCVYAIPNGSFFQNDTVIKLEKDVEESKISPTAFRSKLQVIYIDWSVQLLIFCQLLISFFCPSFRRWHQD